MNKKYAGKKVLIWSLGLHGFGVGAAKYFASQGAIVTVTDLKSKKQLAPSVEKLKKFKNISFVLGEHRVEDFMGSDMIVYGPGIPQTAPFMKIAKKSGAKLLTDIQIFFEACKAPVLGVTGTKGKTTTTMLLYEMIRTTWKTYLGGNVRISLLDSLPRVTKKDRVVAELSSFQLEGLPEIKKSPHGAIITNLFPDHLDRYKSLRAYFNAKFAIFAYQKARDFAVLNYDNKPLRKASRLVPSRLFWFSTKEKVANGMYVQGESVIFAKEGKEHVMFSVTDVQIAGEHNLSNVLAASLLAFLVGVPKTSIVRVVKSFRGVYGRMEKIREFQKRIFINDTTATVPLATQFALKSFTKPVVLICGGSEKNLPFGDLVKEIHRHARFVVLMDDKASYRILSEMKKQKVGVPYVFAKTMKEAVKIAYKASEPGETVLLSPACASFGLFKNEFDRGDQFIAAVRALK